MSHLASSYVALKQTTLYLHTSCQDFLSLSLSVSSREQISSNMFVYAKKKKKEGKENFVVKQNMTGHVAVLLNNLRESRERIERKSRERERKWENWEEMWEHFMGRREGSGNALASLLCHPMKIFISSSSLREKRTDISPTSRFPPQNALVDSQQSLRQDELAQSISVQF